MKKLCLVPMLAASLQEIVDQGCSREKRGIALYEEARRLLAAVDTTDHRFRMHLGDICRYASARQQRLPENAPFMPAVIDLYERLEAFLYRGDPLNVSRQSADNPEGRPW